MLARLRNNFYLAMISLVGLIITLFVTPYGIYRLLSGNLVVGIADLLIVLSSIIAVIYAWRSGDTVRPGQFMAVTFCVGALIVCFNLKTNGVFWIYPFLVFIFLLVSPLTAVVLSMLMLGILIVADLLEPGMIFQSHYQLLAFAVTAFISSFFAYVFAYRTQLQRSELKQLASIDSLTGAGNRHTLNAELELAIQLKQRLQTQFGVILFDLDHFKQINDNYGHRTGDDILVQLVPLISSVLRQSDRVFRYGGEEFLVLLRDINAADLPHLAEKTRLNVERRLLLPDGKPVTLSAGIAMLQPDEDWEQWLHRADMALYQAKNNGRNQVVAA